MALFDVGKRGPHSELTRAAHEAGWTSMSLNNVYTNLCDECSGSEAA